MKLISWNVNGIRAIVGKDFAENVAKLNADVICIQETKAQDDQVKTVISDLGYHLFANSAERKGYSGTTILSKKDPMSVSNGIGIQEHDNEGRVITAEFDKFYLVTVYTPNSGNGLVRLGYRQQWDNDFLQYILKLENIKPVIICGDLNVAHQSIDLKNDKANYNKSAGYTQQEIDGIQKILNAGYIDTFRHFYPNKEKYSWWSYRFNSRAKNIGWRLDYFLASNKLINQIDEAFILNEYFGSDHCPVGITLK